MSGPALGIDLGGTKIYAVITDEKHHVISEAKTDTDSGAPPEKIIDDILELGRTALRPLDLDLREVNHIGVAVPSPVDPETGDCHYANNLGWRDISLRELFQSKLGQDVYLGNDGNLGILAEYTCGAARGTRTAVGLYVGTGLGGGIVANGRLHTGYRGLAGEFGHMIIRQGGRRCGCGRRGCAEAYCSKIAFVKAIRKAVFKRGVHTLLPADKFDRNTKNIKSKHLARAYLAGDPAVCAAINRGAYMLGVTAANAAGLIAPECIVLGGGVISALGSEMLPVFRAGFEEHLIGLDPGMIRIALSSLGDAAVAVGATVLARKKGDV